jgi:hypothetical protein
MAGPTFLVAGDAMLDIVCLANVQRVICASKDVDEVHDSNDDDGIVD